MTSARKIHTNRANACASTGPRTAIGKARSAQNARRHGLSLPVLLDPGLSPDVEALACDIAGADARAEILDKARRIAEAQIELCRARQARIALIASALADPTYESDATTRAKDHLVIRFARVYGAFTPFSPDIMQYLHARPEGPQKLATVFTDMARQLAGFDRYERRALSRRKFAIRAFDLARRNTDTPSAK